MATLHLCWWTRTKCVLCPVRVYPWGDIVGVCSFPLLLRSPLCVLVTYIYIYMCVCVCVNHLKRCKTSFLAGGCRECHSSAANEDGYDILWYRSGTLDRRTCYQFSHQWQPAKPSTGMSFFQLFSNQTTVRFSQSDLLLTSSDGTVASSKDVERILLHCFSRLAIHYFLSGLTEVFLHVRCIPHQ